MPLFFFFYNTHELTFSQGWETGWGHWARIHPHHYHHNHQHSPIKTFTSSSFWLSGPAAPVFTKHRLQTYKGGSSGSKTIPKLFVRWIWSYQRCVITNILHVPAVQFKSVIGGKTINLGTGLISWHQPIQRPVKCVYVEKKFSRVGKPPGLMYLFNVSFLLH